MGKSSKPLHIQLDKTLYEANITHWVELAAQGYTIEVMDGTPPDLYLGFYAMRMTGDMLKQLPSAFDLAVKGARALRYAPVAKDEGAWKGAKKSAKGKGTHTRKNSKVKVEAADSRESVTEAKDTGTGEPAVLTASEIAN